jgi:hypothetical protein
LVDDEMMLDVFLMWFVPLRCDQGRASDENF